MSPPDILEVVLKVVKVFEKLHIPYHLGGSLASSAFGVARATLDVDLVAEIRLEQASLISDLLRVEFYVDTEMILDAIRHPSSFNLIHLESMFKVDVFILKMDPFDREVFQRRFQKVVSRDPSQKLFFATPEDIVLKKLQWYQAGGEVSERQWKDVLGVLKVQGTQLDPTYLKNSV